jgi:hypothetical protein
MTLPKRTPRPRVVPKLDLPSIQSNAQGRIAQALLVENRPADIIKDVRGPQKAEIDAVYQQAKAITPPDSPPAVGGFPGIAHHPIRFAETDGTKNTATLGRGTLLQILTDQWGPERAQEIARNMTDRNVGQPDPGDIFPSIHPDGGDAHFNRPIYILREDGPAKKNGFALPGPDIIQYRKADEGRVGDMETHETNHLAVEYGGKSNNRDFFNTTRENTPAVWKSKMAGDPESLMSPSMSQMLQDAADEYGLDYSPEDGSWRELGAKKPEKLGEWGAISPEDMKHIFTNANTHFWRNQEQLANLMNWKNQAMRRNGYRTLADLPPGLSERDFFRQALTQDLTPIAPRESIEGFNPEHYNPLQLMFRAMRENLTPAGADLQDKVIYRLGAGAGVAAGLSQQGDQ